MMPKAVAETIPTPIPARSTIDKLRHLIEWSGDVWRRKGWAVENLTPRKAANLCLASAEYLLRRDRMIAWPIVVKIDISPLCNLRCTVCIHAKPEGHEYLEKQHFHGSQKMPVDRYRRIIDEIKGKSLAVSLYYLGDPLVHPDVDEMSGIARRAGLNVHLSTNFSFPWSDERIERHAESGVTHLTVCVDGLTQEKYGRTRVGGKIQLVLSNLERLCRYKRAKGLKYPKVEVQYLYFDHNRDEMEPARQLFKKLGVNQVCFRPGSESNWAASVFHVERAKKNRLMAQCDWPHFFTVVKYNGDVIPCCLRRVGEQYAPGGDARTAGNVFETSLREVWDSPTYRQLRRIVSNPAKAAAEPGSEEGFCHGCGRIYEGVMEILDQGEVGACSSEEPVGLLSIARK